jgi:hypothetical protein
MLNDVNAVISSIIILIGVFIAFQEGKT